MKNSETNNIQSHSINTVLSAVLYPELKDVETAVLILENSILFSALTSMLTKEEEKELCMLLYKWKTNFKNHKKEVVDGIISELSEK